MSCDYPIMLDVAGRRCVIVGGGEVAARKASTLAAHGADVLVVAPQSCERIDQLAASHHIALVRERFAPHHLDGAALIFA
ncbi:MAG: hypothetical protein HQK87_06875, partial [Nitrospinae bacterium]|nr:hypothetical protein [Nitrospinota bacterium]